MQTKPNRSEQVTVLGGSIIDYVSASGFLVLKQSLRRDLSHYYHVVCSLPGIIKCEPALQSFLLENNSERGCQEYWGFEASRSHQRLGSNSLTPHFTQTKLAQRQFSFLPVFWALFSFAAKIRGWQRIKSGCGRSLVPLFRCMLHNPSSPTLLVVFNLSAAGLYLFFADVGSAWEKRKRATIYLRSAFGDRLDFKQISTFSCFLLWQMERKVSGREVRAASTSASPGATVLDGQAIRSCCVSPPNQTLSLISLPSALCMQAFIKGAWQSSVLFTLCCFWSGSGALPTTRQLEAWLLQSDSINKPLNWRCCLEAAQRGEAGPGLFCTLGMSTCNSEKAAEGHLFITLIWNLFGNTWGGMKRDFHEGWKIMFLFSRLFRFVSSSPSPSQAKKRKTTLPGMKYGEEILSRNK